MDLAQMRAQNARPFILVDEMGVVIEVNQAFCAEFGWSEPDIVGLSVDVIIPPNLRDAHHIGFSRFIVTTQSSILNQDLVLPAVDKAGRVFQATHHIIAEQQAGKWLIAATIVRIRTDGE